MKMPSILMISHSAETSGAPRVLLDVADILRKHYHVTLLFPAHGPMTDLAAKCGHEVIVVPNPQKGLSECRSLMEKARLLFGRIRHILGVRRVARKGRYDLIYLNSSASLYSGIGLFMTPYRRLWHMHEDLSQNSPGAWIKRRVIAHRCALVIFVSPSNAGIFGGPPTDIAWRTIPNGVEVGHFVNPAEDSEYRARYQDCPENLCVGTLSFISHRKGIDIFLQAMERVCRHHPEVRAVIPGDLSAAETDYAALIGELANRPGLSGRVFFPGYCRNAPGYLTSLTLFVLPSRNDPMPLSVLEAMAAGKAIVATDVGCVREMLNPPECGIIVPPGDSTALADAILEALDNPGKLKDMGKAARKRAGLHYSPERFQSEILSAVRDALQ